MNNELFWFPLHSGDFLSKSSLLSCEACGCYILLLVHLCRHGHIANKRRQISQVCKGASPASIKAALGLLQRSDNGFFCEELEEQRQKLMAQKLRKSMAGKIGAASRWNKDAQEFRELQKQLTHNLKD